MSAASRVLLLFASIHGVLTAEAALKAACVPLDLVPVPKEISPDCGMAIAVAPLDRGRALRALAASPPSRVLDAWRA